MGYYGGWAPYVSVAERRKKAEKETAKAKKSGISLSPIEPYRGAIAKTFWGKAWCDNLEAYSDYANRMPRGRTYVRNGSVIDLKIAQGEIQAQVIGSSLYRVSVRVSAVATAPWQAISKDCAGSIDSLVELLQGKLSTAVMQRICAPRTGLFPAPKEIQLSCSCPDSASMCKHIAAVLYGVGARLDQQPELLFALRGVDAKDLVTLAGTGLPKSTTGVAAEKVLDDEMLADVFGLEMDEFVAPVKLPKSLGARKTTPTLKAPQKGEKQAAKKSVKKTALTRESLTAILLPPATKVSKPAESKKTKPLPVSKPVKLVVAAKKVTAAKSVTATSGVPPKSSARKDAGGTTRAVPKVLQNKKTGVKRMA